MTENIGKGKIKLRVLKNNNTMNVDWEAHIFTSYFYRVNCILKSVCTKQRGWVDCGAMRPISGLRLFG